MAAWAPNLRVAIFCIFLPTCILGFIGWLDDRRGLPIWFRLISYAGVSAAYVFLFERSLGFLNAAWLEGLLAAFFLLALINVTNFMDGIDGIIVASFLPLLCLSAVLAMFGGLSDLSGFIAVCLAGSLLGFFVFNRPKARIFLGDSGSIAIGFLAGVVLLDLAKRYGIALALILPLYIFCDAGLTLARRFLRSERFWMSHREHFYQRAFDSGHSNQSIIGRVFLCNIMLALIVFGSINWSGFGTIFPFVASSLIVGLLIMSLSRASPGAFASKRGHG